MIRIIKEAAGYVQQNIESGGGGGSFDRLSFFDISRDFATQGDFITETAASKTWFVSAPNEVSANAGSSNGNELFSNDTSGHASSEGWEVVTGGIKILGSEKAIKVRMYDGTAEDGLSHDNDEDYVLAYLETFQAGMSTDRRKKFNGPGDKIQNNNPKNWKHNQDYSTSAVSYVEASDDSVEVEFDTDPVSDTLIFFAKMRDLSNNRIYQWRGDVVSGADRTDLEVNDTVSQTTADGEAWYLVPGNIRNDGSDEMEHFWQEDSILRQYGYKKMAVAAGNFATVDTAIGDYFESIVATFFP